MQLMLIFFSKALVKHSINVTITHPTPNITITEKVFSMFHFSLSWRALHLPQPLLIPRPRVTLDTIGIVFMVASWHRPRGGVTLVTPASVWTPDKEARGLSRWLASQCLSSGLINIIFRFKLSASMGWAGCRGQTESLSHWEIVVVWDWQEGVSKQNQGF